MRSKTPRRATRVFTMESLETRRMMTATMEAATASSTLQIDASILSEINSPAMIRQIDLNQLVDIAEFKSVSTEIGERKNVVLDSLGPGAANDVAANSLDALKESESGRSGNPLDNQASLLVGSKNAQVSEDSPQEQTKWEAFKTWLSSVFSSGASGAGAKTVTGNAAGAVTGTALGILTANTDSPESKRNEAEGLFGLVRLGKKGTSNSNAADQLDQLNYDGTTENPDADPPSSGVITAEQIDAVLARLMADKEYLEMTSKGGGPINDEATSSGRTNTLGLWTSEMGMSTSTATEYDHVRIQTIVSADKLPAAKD